MFVLIYTEINGETEVYTILKALRGITPYKVLGVCNLVAEVRLEDYKTARRALKTIRSLNKVVSAEAMFTVKG